MRPPALVFGWLGLAILLLVRSFATGLTMLGLAHTIPLMPNLSKEVNREAASPTLPAGVQ